MGSRSLRFLNQSAHSRVANSTAAKFRHGPRRWITFSLVEPVDGYGEGIVVGSPDAADRRLYACFSQALGVFDRDVLTASVAMVHEPAAMDRPPIMQGRLRRVEDGAGVCRGRDPPA